METIEVDLTIRDISLIVHYLYEVKSLFEIDSTSNKAREIDEIIEKLFK